MKVAVVSFCACFAVSVIIVWNSFPATGGASVGPSGEPEVLAEQSPSGVGSVAVGPGFVAQSTTSSDLNSDVESATETNVLSALRFTVRSSKGEPSPQVLVRASSNEKNYEARTDELGIAFIEAVPAGSYELWVKPANGDRVLRGKSRVDVREGEEFQVELVLPEFDGAIDGRVVDSSGRPLAEAVVSYTVLHVLDETGDFALSPSMGETPSVRTDHDGYFSIENLQAAEFELFVEAGDDHGAAKKSAVTGDGEFELVVPLGRTFTLSGTVRSAKDPLAFATVKPARTDPVRTAVDGRFEVSVNLSKRAKSLSVFVSCAGHQGKSITVPAANFDDAAFEMDVQLEPVAQVASVRGVVRDVDGNGLVGERVRLYSPRTASRFDVRSRSDGQFTIRGVPVGDDYRLQVFPISYHRDHRETLNVPAEGAQLSLVLQPLGSGRIRGRCIDANGRGLPGWTFRVRSDQSSGVAVEFRCDDEGGFDIEEVPEGRLEFESEHFARHRIRATTLEPGGSLVLSLRVDYGDEDIVGRIVDLEGQAIADATLSLSWRDESEGVSTSLRSTKSADDGAFRIARVGPGVHRLDVRAEGFVKQEIEIAGAKSNLEIRLAPAISD